MSKFKGSTIDDFISFRNCCLTSYDWSLSNKSYKTLCYQGVKVKKGFVCLKAVTELFVDYDLMQIFDCLNDENYRNQWDGLLLNRKIVETIDDCNCIIHYTTKIPFISNREYVYYKSIWMSDNKDEFIIFNKSTTHPDCPQTTKFLKKDGNGKIIFYYLLNNSFGGKVPSRVTNYLISSQGYTLMKNLSISCSKYPAWKEKHNPMYKPWRTMNDKLSLPI
ncbi:Phosphatidylcholine transfer protein [Entamoeba marina]